jgi:2-octaprenylphenol hydroxylase
VASDAAANLLGQEARAFEQHVSRASGEVLGALRLASERHAFPLVSQVAERYVTSRCALIGDAAHVIHPLAGQGANLGLLDAAALTEVIEGALRTREDPGALRALRRYEQQRRTHNLAMAAAMSVFERGFALGGPIGSALVRAGLGTVQHSAALRHWFARQALGPPTRSI